MSAKGVRKRRRLSKVLVLTALHRYPWVDKSRRKAGMPSGRRRPETMMFVSYTALIT